ncbi:hypothetical protein J4205_01070 [Candidatus Pacearchaeota archaeon]|nr:hypothetical protein [uncultured archaeon]MBS3066388.1 hypothetical protein [Candidatus Pacearchaeota archaeon]
MENYVQLIPREIREASRPRARFLSSEEQTKYDEAVKEFNSEKARKTLAVSQKGSNLPKVILLNNLGIRTANTSQLYNIWYANSGFLSGTYEDVASVVLRSNGDSHNPNDLLAKELAKSIDRSFEHSYVLTGLKLKEDDNSQYGLILVPGKNFEYFKAPELDHLNNQKKFSRVDERGIPIFEDNGSKTLYTRQDGLSRFFIYGYSYLFSYNWLLSDSDSDGRVVVVDAEGVAPNLEDYIANLNQERTRLKAEVDVRYATAIGILQDKK